MKKITTILSMPKGRRIVNHYKKYCADNGRQAEVILVSSDGRQYCVCCPCELNAAGKKIMGGN